MKYVKFSENIQTKNTLVVSLHPHILVPLSQKRDPVTSALLSALGFVVVSASSPAGGAAFRRGRVAEVVGGAEAPRRSWARRLPGGTSPRLLPGAACGREGWAVVVLALLGGSWKGGRSRWQVPRDGVLVRA